MGLSVERRWYCNWMNRNEKGNEEGGSEVIVVVNEYKVVLGWICCGVMRLVFGVVMNP